MLQTGKNVSSIRRSARRPGQGARPNRMTTSTSSREKSVRSLDTETRTSRSGWRSRSRPMRGMSQFAARLGRRADREDARVLGPQRPRGRLVEAVEDVGEVRREALAGARQRDALARQPVEQRAPEPGLERLDLLADRARRHGELVAGLVEVEMPGGGLEGAQGGERRKTATGHGRPSQTWAEAKDFSFAPTLRREHHPA